MNEAQKTHTLTLEGTGAINLDDLTLGGEVKSIKLGTGDYIAKLENTDITINSDKKAYLDQVILFNTTAHVEGHENGQKEDAFYYVVDFENKDGVKVHVWNDRPIYAFIVDHVSSSDNTGSATVTFTPCD